MNNKILGNAGEELAAQHLKEKGYRILDTNWRHHHLELDIVAEKDDKIVFVEVKTRSSLYFANPEDAVNFNKINRILNAAEAYLAINRVYKTPRYDIIAIARIGNKYHINHIEDAFISPVY